MPFNKPKLAPRVGPPVLIWKSFIWSLINALSGLFILSAVVTPGIVFAFSILVCFINSGFKFNCLSTYFLKSSNCFSGLIVGAPIYLFLKNAFTPIFLSFLSASSFVINPCFKEFKITSFSLLAVLKAICPFE